MGTNKVQATSTTVCEKHGCQFVEDEITKMLHGSALNWDPNREYAPHYICAECQQEREDAIKAQEELKEKKEREESIHRGIPRIFHNAKLDDISQHKAVYDFALNGKGFLFIHGTCGTGKTHAMCAIKKHFNTVGKYCELCFASNLFMEIRNSFNNTSKDTEYDIISKYCPKLEYWDKSDRFSIFDDIGAQKLSEYALEVWYTIINERYSSGLKTIFTSNLSLREISVSMSDRIASRLASGIVYEMKGNDRRLIK